MHGGQDAGPPHGKRTRLDGRAGATGGRPHDDAICESFTPVAVGNHRRLDRGGPGYQARGQAPLHRTWRARSPGAAGAHGRGNQRRLGRRGVCARAGDLLAVFGIEVHWGSDSCLSALPRDTIGPMRLPDRARTLYKDRNLPQEKNRFPDLNHFLQLKRDLWRRPNSRAALMVGAGISRNAEPSPGSRSGFPMWEELSTAMFEEIYPAPDNPDERRVHDKRSRSINPLRIASEYDAAFGPATLASFIRDNIPDADHQPGPIHKLLLQLPWRDVFTTNYDTLLERTEVSGRVYTPVRTTLDLTNADSPRIVKLHGSLPSHTPFIITEEHYRKYPTCYAPFVNTVRQSLIENSLVLVGFSGDDPNFLEWTGWIRDELGGHHAPIYLVGWLSLDGVQRSLLNQRGVTPIDLAPLFDLSKHRDNRHVVALEWFLSDILSARPQRPENWPLPKWPGDTQLGDDTATALSRRWRSKRLEYPGWLVPTSEARASLWIETSLHASQLIEWTKHQSAKIGIHTLREINWRLETSMIPIFDDFRDPFEAAVSELFPMRNDGDSNSIPVVIESDPESAASWMEVALALLRSAREHYDEERWTGLNDRIGAVVPTCPEFADRHRYEQALWKVWNLDMGGARSLIQDWTPSYHTPLARMWKAGLLAELDHLTESRSILRSVLSDVRRSILSTQGQRIDLLSLEGWCTYLLFAVERTIGTSRRSEFSERWQELKEWDCSPLPLLAYFRNVISDTPPAKTEPYKIVPDFDPGRRRETYALGGGDTVEPWLPAFAYIRLLEQVGIPIRMRHWNITGDTLANACKWTVSLTRFWSPALLIRAGKTEELKKRRFMDRTQVATMRPELSRRLTRWAIEALERQLPLAGSSRTAIDMSSLSLVGSLLEVLSRLTVRMQSATLQRAFEIGLSLYQTPDALRDVFLSRKSGEWFSRLYMAADARQLVGWIPELLKFPLSAQRDRSVAAWPDPMSVFPADRVNVAAYGEPRTAIDDAVNWLLHRYSSESGEARHRAVRRLEIVYHAGYMSETQESSFAEVLWDGADGEALPDLPGVSIFNYLHLPHPSEIDVMSRIRMRLLNSPIERMVSVSPRTVSVSDSISQNLMDLFLVSKPLVEIRDAPQGKIEWTNEEAATLWKSLVEWWTNDKRGLSIESDPVSNRLAENFKILGDLMCRLLPMLDLSSEVWMKSNRFWIIRGSIGST